MPQVIEVPGVGPVEFPDGMTDDDIVRAIQGMEAGPQNQDWQARTRARARSIPPIDTDPTSGMSFADQALAGVGMWATDRARGVQQRLGLRDGSDTESQRAIDAPLRDSPGGGYGELVGPVASTLPVAGLGALNTLRGAAAFGAGYGATEPTETGLETATNIGLGGLLGLGGQWVGNRVANALGNRLNQRSAAALGREEADAVSNATTQSARDAGYVVPPSTTNPSAMNRAVESLGGKVATQRQAALMNQANTDRLVRQELGLPENAPLTRETLNRVRQEAAQVYRQIQDAGDIVPDAQYLDDLAALEQNIARIADDFPDLDIGARPEIRQLIDGLLVDGFSSRGALELTRTLRAQASDLFRSASMGSGNPGARALAQATRDAADVVEEQIMRHLKANGGEAAADAFDAARRRIAMTHTVENALQESTGRINAARLASELGRGRPLSGNLETAARTAEAFPSAMRLPKDSPVSLVNAGVSLGSGGATLGFTGNPLMALLAAAAVPAGRAGARKLALGPLQGNLRPNYAPNKLGTLMLEGGRYGARRAGPLAAVMAANQ